MAIGWDLCLACTNGKHVASLVTLNLGSGLGVSADLTAHDHILCSWWLFRWNHMALAWPSSERKQDGGPREGMVCPGGCEINMRLSSNDKIAPWGGEPGTGDIQVRPQDTSGPHTQLTCSRNQARGDTSSSRGQSEHYNGVRQGSKQFLGVHIYSHPPEQNEGPVGSVRFTLQARP